MLSFNPFIQLKRKELSTKTIIFHVEVEANPFSYTHTLLLSLYPILINNFLDLFFCICPFQSLFYHFNVFLCP